MLQNTTSEFRKMILKLINLTVNQSKIPQEWKESINNVAKKKIKVVVIRKSISLTSCIVKLAGRLILSKIKEFMDSHHLIIKQQSGFRKQRQTRDNIFFLSIKELESLNRRKRMFTFFFDIASALDKVWQNGLVYKLIDSKFPNHLISWIKEFLKNRLFCVRVESVITSKLQVITIRFTFFGGEGFFLRR
jgi:hypothetical protein